jgi:putative Mg2+ transporter-C (MgtC) family protein
MRDILWQELTSGLGDAGQLGRVILRLIAAVFLGGIVGIERETMHKPAGLRTHMLVCLGTAVFVIACSSVGMSMDGLSRVIQGIVTGIGFIGAGTILKRTEEREVKGLTTAASVWMAAAIGVTVGLGSLGIALMITVLALIILAIERVEHQIVKRRSSGAKSSRS